MTEKSHKYLSDILMAIDLIENFIADTPDFNLYQKDLKTQSAIERQLAIIGEALNKLRQTESDLFIQNDKQIIGFRNRLVHAYDSIDNAIVWVIGEKTFTRIKTRSKAIIRLAEQNQLPIPHNRNWAIELKSV